ncbi:mad2l1-1 [Symbiodinium necroappetens]|uniref:Mad2l1-1 protein n=1 Tax=Symbiodinium necroappetens TaxID=1628268 RepID=A0A813CD65_9DINO|nr:mad2l1-1 [Symbiodinium necroappetens]
MPFWGLRFMRSTPNLQLSSRRCILTLRASNFPEIFDRRPSTADAAFAGDPLCQLEASRRGKVIQKLLRDNSAIFSPSGTSSEAPRGLRVNGQRRARHQSEFDWSLNGRRMECKSTRLAWDPSQSRWFARWRAIKFRKEDSNSACSFDDLILVLHSPFRLDIIMHDFNAFVNTQGDRTPTIGHTVCCRASAASTDALHASESIIQKLIQHPGSCHHIASFRTDAEPVTGAVTDELSTSSYAKSWGHYRNAPLAELSAASRGLLLQDLAYRIDQMLHPSSAFALSPESEERGIRRGSADWCRDGRLVEFKSSKISWVDSAQAWRIRFCCIKDTLHRPDGFSPFDELWLGIYSPGAFYLVHHRGDFAKTSNGVATACLGRAIVLSTPSHGADISLAAKCLLAKFESNGCKLLAQVVW